MSELGAEGIIANVPEQEYHNGPGISQSNLKILGAKSPKHYKHAVDNPKSPTAAMQFGSLFHCNLLQPEKLDEQYAKGPNCEKRKADDKALWESFYQANNERIMLDHHGAITTRDPDGKWRTEHALTLDVSDTMKFAINSNKIAMRALETGGSELSLYSKDDDTGLLKRCRIDRVPEGGNAIVDVKTTLDASPKGFAKSVANFGYHVQGAYYLDICNDLGMEKECFVFVAIEKEPPYGVGIYQLSKDAIAHGRSQYKEWLEVLAKCLDKDEWPGYPEKFISIDLPSWA